MVDICTHELVEVKPLLWGVLDVVKLRPEQVIRYLEFNAHAGAVPPVSLPKDLVIGSGAETGKTDLVATLLDHAVDHRFNEVL
jgi:hypothetical protein